MNTLISKALVQGSVRPEDLEFMAVRPEDVAKELAELANEIADQVLAHPDPDPGVKRWWAGQVNAAYRTILGYEGDCVGICRMLADATERWSSGSDEPSHHAVESVRQFIAIFEPVRAPKIDPALIANALRASGRRPGRPRKDEKAENKWIAIREVARKLGYQVPTWKALRRGCQRRDETRRSIIGANNWRL